MEIDLDYWTRGELSCHVMSHLPMRSVHVVKSEIRSIDHIVHRNIFDFDDLARRLCRVLRRQLGGYFRTCRPLDTHLATPRRRFKVGSAFVLMSDVVSS
jgi:hypothetical protein